MPLLRRLAANPRFELEACRQAANSGHQCTRVSLQILFKIYVCLFGCLLTWLILHHRMIAQCRFPYSDTRISRVQSSRVWIHSPRLSFWKLSVADMTIQAALAVCLCRCLFSPYSSLSILCQSGLNVPVAMVVIRLIGFPTCFKVKTVHLFHGLKIEIFED